MSARKKNWRRDPRKLVFQLRKGVFSGEFIYCAFRVLPNGSSRGAPLVLVLDLVLVYSPDYTNLPRHGFKPSTATRTVMAEWRVKPVFAGCTRPAAFRYATETRKASRRREHAFPRRPLEHTVIISPSLQLQPVIRVQGGSFLSGRWALPKASSEFWHRRKGSPSSYAFFNRHVASL